MLENLYKARPQNGRKKIYIYLKFLYTEKKNIHIYIKFLYTKCLISYIILLQFKNKRNMVCGP